MEGASEHWQQVDALLTRNGSHVRLDSCATHSLQIGHLCMPPLLFLHSPMMLSSSPSSHQCKKMAVSYCLASALDILGQGSNQARRIRATSSRIGGRSEESSKGQPWLWEGGKKTQSQSYTNGDMKQEFYQWETACPTTPEEIVQSCLCLFFPDLGIVFLLCIALNPIPSNFLVVQLLRLQISSRE